MINYLNGIVKSAEEKEITLAIGPIGLAVQVPQVGIFKVGETIELHAHMHWNQEQGPSLFGFTTLLDRTIFRLVIGCSGVGPKIALAVLADIGSERFLEGVQAGDDRVLSKVSGIGPKKAEQMIVQLKHKVAKLVEQGVELNGASTVTQWHNVSEVLQSLNYSRTEVNGAMRYLRDNQPEEQLPFDQMVRRALSFLAKKT